MKIVYFGTPSFSVNALEKLFNSKHEILAVVSQKDKLGNRNKLIFSPVKEFALKNNIKILQYEKIRKEGVEDLKKLNADIYITCAYGQIISQEIIDIPKYGILNIHASLLPLYRGSSPIQQAIINGDKETGITIMKTVLQVDAGDILHVEKINIDKKETSETLFQKLSILGSEAILKALDKIENDPIFIKQDDTKATFCKMIKKEDGLINFEEKFDLIERKIRAMQNWPSAYTYLDGKLLKIFDINLIEERENKEYPFIYIKDKKILVDAKFSTFEIKELQFEGSRRMSSNDFINGNKLKHRMELKNDRV